MRNLEPGRRSPRAWPHVASKSLNGPVARGLGGAAVGTGWNCLLTPHCECWAPAALMAMLSKGAQGPQRRHRRVAVSGELGIHARARRRGSPSRSWATRRNCSDLVGWGGGRERIAKEAEGMAGSPGLAVTGVAQATQKPLRPSPHRCPRLLEGCESRSGRIPEAWFGVLKQAGIAGTRRAGSSSARCSAPEDRKPGGSRHIGLDQGQRRSGGAGAHAKAAEEQVASKVAKTAARKG